MNIDPQLTANVISAAAGASGTVATLLQKIMAAASKVGIAVLPKVIHEVAVALEAQYPSEAALILALEGILNGLMPAPTV